MVRISDVRQLALLMHSHDRGRVCPGNGHALMHAAQSGSAHAREPRGHFFRDFACGLARSFLGRFRRHLPDPFNGRRGKTRHDFHINATQRLLVGPSANPLGKISASRYERWRRGAKRDENMTFGAVWHVLASGAGRQQRAKDKAERMWRAACGARRRSAPRTSGARGATRYAKRSLTDPGARACARGAAHGDRQGAAPRSARLPCGLKGIVA